MATQVEGQDMPMGSLTTEPTPSPASVICKHAVPGSALHTLRGLDCEELTVGRASTRAQAMTVTRIADLDIIAEELYSHLARCLLIPILRQWSQCLDRQ